MSVALVALVYLTYVLNEAGMFLPVRLADGNLVPCLAVLQRVPPSLTAEETARRVRAELESSAPSVWSQIMSRQSGADPHDYSGDVHSPDHERTCDPEPGALMAVHFGRVRTGGKGLTASAAGVILEHGKDALGDASHAAWKRKLRSVHGFDVCLVHCDAPGYLFVSPWAGVLSERVRRLRVNKKMGRVLARDSPRSRVASGCYIEVFSPSKRSALTFVPRHGRLQELRELLGVPAFDRIG